MALPTIKPIILSYNMPEEASRLYKKLQADGFSDVLLVDNGSDMHPPSPHANFRLPKNIRANGQARMALIYSMDYFPADYYWLISTSADLYPQANYRQAIEASLSRLSAFRVGVLSPTFDCPTALPAQQHLSANAPETTSICFFLEATANVLAHNLLEKCREDGAAFFETRLTRGWGCDYELCHEAVLHGFWCMADQAIAAGWKRNLGYHKGVGGESIQHYYDQASAEMNAVMADKYGERWIMNFLRDFTSAVKRSSPPLPVQYHSHFSSGPYEGPSMLQSLTNRTKDILKNGLRRTPLAKARSILRMLRSRF
ncbi:MAG: hypothetical protein C4523_13810 [Myxococcales bacterium]|nr:MAG: hypothetical protein C4523_13810 [Myxococcales bacterium]